MGSVKTPPPRDYAKEMRENYEAQIELAPELYASEASQEYGRPAYARLDLEILKDTMLGTQDSPGLLALYEQHVMPRLAAAESAGRAVSREADIADVERLGARATEAFRSANPEQAALLKAMNEQAMSELNAGAGLPPALAREIEQQIRGSQAARGMGYGMADVGQEALIKGLQAEQLQRRRQQFAQNVIGMNAATATDPFLAILGRPGVQVGQAAGITSQGQGFNPGSVFNPESAYAGALQTQNFQTASDAAIASANNKAALIGSGIQAAGSIAGGFASRPPACWVAREVYGSENPKWLLFREWMLHRAPNWLRSVYIRHGELFAQWIKGKPRIKSVIRRWMDSKIKEHTKEA